MKPPGMNSAELKAYGKGYGAATRKFQHKIKALKVQLGNDFKRVLDVASQPAVKADADYEAIARRDFERSVYEQCDKEDRENTA